ATSDSGRYTFADLPAGSYRLFVRRIGYAPASVDVELSEGDASLLSIGLVVLPVQLRPLRVQETGSANDDAYTDAVERGAARVATARRRQEEFLSSDVRELTSSDVVESATFGGEDFLRAMQRLPGVAPADDWSARTWVRGAGWNPSRVFFDGLPLFDPLQA